jgi:hypothetical protein
MHFPENVGRFEREIESVHRRIVAFRFGQQVNGGQAGEQQTGLLTERPPYFHIVIVLIQGA